jgi:hypothetical protein
VDPDRIEAASQMPAERHSIGRKGSTSRVVYKRPCESLADIGSVGRVGLLISFSSGLLLNQFPLLVMPVVCRRSDLELSPVATGERWPQIDSEPRHAFAFAPSRLDLEASRCDL